MSETHPPKAYKNQDFLGGAEARPLRLLAEFLEPKQRFSQHGINNTVVMFGSARIQTDEEAQKACDSIRQRLAQSDGKAPHLEQALRIAERRATLSAMYDDTREIARRLTEWSLSLDESSRIVICSGGGPGIMEAANRGAQDAGGVSFHYFFMRKFWFAYLCRAVVVFPGGFGTLDEMAELVTLAQTGKLQKQIPIVLYNRQYWDEVLNLQALVDWGMISSSDLDLFTWCNTPDEAVGCLTNVLNGS